MCSIVAELTKHEGLYLKHIHPHPLFYEVNPFIHVGCVLTSYNRALLRAIGATFAAQGNLMPYWQLMHSQCGYRIQKHAWRCKLCDFDLCNKCAARKDAAEVGENVLRSDSGVKMDSTLDNSVYFKRALQLACERALHWVS